MNAHTPFDANQDWTNPYCQNSSNDPMVDALLGNAYHAVRTVYCNLGNLKSLYDFLNQYGMVIGVNSEEELKALSTQVKYSRIYGFSRAGDRQVTDYLYVEGDRTGILPNDTTATGSWITVATSGSSGGGASSGEGAYIPWVYSNGSATGGETTINVPDGTVGVPFIIVNGDVQYVGRGFEFNVDSLSVTLAQPLEEGDEVVFLLTGVPAVPDNPHVNDWVQINWLYNNGAAVGGEQIIAVPYTFQSVPAVYKNGLRLYKGLTTESYTADPDNQRILLTEPLVTNDRLIVQIGGEVQVLEAADHTLQEIARATNVKDSEVILSTDSTQFLNGKKVIYSVSEQKAYGLPSLPSNVYISSVSNGQLTYNPGNITVTLLPTQQEINTRELWRRSLAEAGYNLVDGSFEAGGTLVNANDVLLQERTGKAFSGPAGTVAAGTNPATGGFVDRSDVVASVNMNEVMLSRYWNAAMADHSQALRNALADYDIVTVDACPSGNWVMKTPVSVTPGKKILSQTFKESPWKSDPDYVKENWREVILCRDTFSLQCADGVEVNGPAFWYDQQNYAIQQSGSSADGLTDFVQYPPTIDHTGTYGIVDVHNCLVLGAWQFFRSQTANNFEKGHISNIRGWCVYNCVESWYSSDMLYFENIHMNPNSLNNLPGHNRNDNTNQKYTNRTQLFRLGRCDGGWITNCFIYACRDFINFFEFSSTALTGGSIRMQNVAADICNTMVRCRSRHRNFGVAVSNGWCVPNIQKILNDDGQYVSQESGILRLDDPTGALETENLTVDFSNFVVSIGGTHSWFSNSGPYKRMVHFGAKWTLTAVNMTNCMFNNLETLDHNDLSTFIEGIVDNKGNQVNIRDCGLRTNPIEIFTMLNTQIASKGSSYPLTFDSLVSSVTGSATTPRFKRSWRDGANEFKIQGGRKDTNGFVRLFELLINSTEYVRVSSDKKNLELPIGAYNEGHLVLGSGSAQWHIWAAGNQIRVKYGSHPTSAGDGKLLIANS